MSYEAWSGMFAGGFMRFMTFLFFLALFYHAWVGIRDIYMDYIKPVGIRLALHCDHPLSAHRLRRLGCPNPGGCKVVKVAKRTFDAVIVGAGGAGLRGTCNSPSPA